MNRPWVLTLYLLVVSVGVFALPATAKPLGVPALILLQVAVLGLTGKLSGRAAALIWRLKWLFCFIILGNALLPSEGARYLSASGPGSWLNLDGAMSGLLMSGQIVVVVLASHVVRTVGDPDALVRGLRTFRVTPLLAYSIDSTLALLDGDLATAPAMSRGGGGGGGGGGGRRRREAAASEADPAPARSLRAAIDDLRRNGAQSLVDRVREALERGARRAEAYGLDSRRAHDVGVLAGIAAVMMTFKMLKVLPGIPFASGHKAMFFIPLYVLAAELTYTRWGGTLAGTIMGLIGFLNGDGRYGVFEILKHVAPGLFLDVTWPIVRRLPRRVWVYCVLGLLASGVSRTTELALAAATGDRVGILAYTAINMIPGLLAGALSGFVTYPLIVALGGKASEGVSSESAAGPAHRVPASDARSGDVERAANEPVSTSSTSA